MGNADQRSGTEREPSGNVAGFADQSRTIADVRAKAWETRRRKYGPKGYGPGAYGLGERPAKEWPSFEYEDGYPEDEDFKAFSRKRPPLDFDRAAQWLMRELPRAAEHMPCFCTVDDAIDIMREPVKLLSFSTGGWSGAESLIGLIQRRFDMHHFMLSWKRGGHYVFEIPCRRLSRAQSKSTAVPGV